MKKLFLFSLLIPFQVFSQNISVDKLIGDWVKTDVRMRDGSAIYTPELTEASFRYIFKPGGEVTIVYNGKTTNTVYQLRGKRLTLGNDSAYDIESLSDIKMVLQEDSTIESPLKLYLEPAKFHNLGFVPESYITKGNDTVYIAKRDYLEPFFLNSKANVMEFVYANFDFPERKKGTFLVRFIVTDKGELKAIKILQSSDEKYNDRLIKAVQRTAGKWQAASWEGRPVNTETQLYFDMTPPAESSDTPSTVEQKNSLSQDYFVSGTSYFENRQYRQALEYFNKSIELNAFNVNAYYNRAATFMKLRQKDAACKDFKTLIQLQQKKGQELYDKYCK